MRQFSKMLKYVVLVMVIGQLSQAQKSFYAGRQSRYPQVLAKYTSTSTTTTTPSTATDAGSLDNRIGGNSISPVAVDPTSSPDDSVDDFQKFLKRVASWPVDKQPFWYRNREAIWDQINREAYGRNPQQPSGFDRSPFAGRGRN